MLFFDFILCMIKGLLNDVVDLVQDLLCDVWQIVWEFDDSIGCVENLLIEIEVQVVIQCSKCDVVDDKVRKYEDGVKCVLQGGDEVFVCEVFVVQLNVEVECDVFVVELMMFELLVDKLKGQIVDMCQCCNDLNVCLNILQVKQEIVQVKDVVVSVLGGIGGKNLFEDFQKFEDKVVLQNVCLDVCFNLVDMLSGKVFDDKFVVLNKGLLVEDCFVVLKKQFDMFVQ